MIIFYRILPRAATLVRYFCGHEKNLLCVKNHPQPTPSSLLPISIYLVRYFYKPLANNIIFRRWTTYP